MMVKRKIHFPLTQDSEGYPPFSNESVWGKSTDNQSHYEIDNIPFFARQATLGDVVRVAKSGGNLVFVQIVKKSPRSLVRIIFFKSRRINSVRQRLKELGCSSEALGIKPIIAVDIPGNVVIEPVRKYLSDLEKEEVLTYEEPILRHRVGRRRNK